MISSFQPWIAAASQGRSPEWRSVCGTPPWGPWPAPDFFPRALWNDQRVCCRWKKHQDLHGWRDIYIYVCFIMLYYIIIYYITWYYIIFYEIIFYYIILYYIKLYYIIILVYYILFYIIFNYMLLYYMKLSYTIFLNILHEITCMHVCMYVCMYVGR